MESKYKYIIGTVIGLVIIAIIIIVVVLEVKAHKKSTQPSLSQSTPSSQPQQSSLYPQGLYEGENIILIGHPESVYLLQNGSKHLNNSALKSYVNIIGASVNQTTFDSIPTGAPVS